ncbi:hypothetical protein [Streptomyces genisteinicus]|uniref:Protein kilB n=1 Tax=Streptomyces genisteinicus TaxID=2768068 RepID=A0A7H0HQD9_9ACTN|nr:hypothetical protein [Streptomyces genisteinicus]QNP62755.1 hypothetical protein IAG43_07265 [Streptomyces genisteinicus]
MWATVIAVAGTLLGSVATHLFQHRTTERTAALAREEQLRQERITAYSAFAGALVDYRRGQNDRWHRAQETPGSAVAEAARIDSYRLRSGAHQALIRVQLVCDDPQALALAAEAFEVTNCIHEAPDEPERSRRSEQARETLSEFIGAAAPGVR